METRILFLAANPMDTPRLRLDQEVREIEEGLQLAERRTQFVTRVKWAARAKDIRRAMLDFRPSIVHFCGHGAGAMGIVFEDDNGGTRLVSGEALAGFFRLFANKKVECVVLNACYSETQADAIAQHISYVVGMKEGISDAVAVEFAVAFYDALGAGETFEFAYSLACNAIQWTGVPEHLTPILRSRRLSANATSQQNLPNYHEDDTAEGRTDSPSHNTGRQVLSSNVTGGDSSGQLADPDMPTFSPLIIDGPNFINRVLDLHVDKDIIAAQLTLDGFRTRLNAILAEKQIPVQVDLVEFVCSKKLFGQGPSKFTQQERDSMLERLMDERGVHVEEVSLPGVSEKGVDATVALMLETYLDRGESVFLVSHDRDYVPVLRKLRGKGKRIYLVALNEDFPRELSNEAYQTLRMDGEWRHFFAYSYPRYYVNRAFTKEQFRRMLSNADDRQHNQLRVNHNGEVYYSHEHIAWQGIDDVRFRYETLIAYNGYVGPRAASDAEYVTEEFDDLVYGWSHGAKGYYDYPTRREGV